MNYVLWVVLSNFRYLIFPFLYLLADRILTFFLASMLSLVGDMKLESFLTRALLPKISMYSRSKG